MSLTYKFTDSQCTTALEEIKNKVGPGIADMSKALTLVLSGPDDKVLNAAKIAEKYGGGLQTPVPIGSL